MNLRESMVGVALTMAMVAGSVARGEPPAASPSSDDKSKQPAPRVAPKKPGFAVVELFTSEGCSSCPPADELAAKVAREAKERGESVYVLAMHVDYWNYLGWKDPFAQAQFTKRQRAYAEAIGKRGGNSGVFTPEMVVNGAVGFTGSDAAAAKREIDRALAVGGRLKLEASIDARKAGDPVHVHAEVKGDSRWTMVSVALVEDGLRSDVKAGENAGKTLVHDRVARAFAQAVVKDDQADVAVVPPAGADEAKCHIVVYAQEQRTLTVLAATELPLVSAPVTQGANAGSAEGTTPVAGDPARKQTSGK